MHTAQLNRMDWNIILRFICWLSENENGLWIKLSICPSVSVTIKDRLLMDNNNSNLVEDDNLMT